jgi:hypothetical protein
MDEGKAALEHRLEALEARLRRLETLVGEQWAETSRASGPQRPSNGGGHGATGPRAPAPVRCGAVLVPDRPQTAQAALEAFPHVVQTLVLTWGYPECEAYLARLVVDERGGRRGFSMDAMDELLFLSELLRFRNAMARLPAWPGTPTDVWEESAGRRGRSIF